MQMKCVSVILFLTMLTLCSCGPESMLHKAVDAVAGAVPLPATITNVMKSALKQAIHKGGKNTNRMHVQQRHRRDVRR
uniref:Venom peptide Ht_169 n=1 Tax=Hadogenes troglodytes TaxID=1577150 RepID=A0A1B3IJ72_9SCOR|nr:venom peptide Ht_169 [Hadogenes troglodytes]